MRTSTLMLGGGLCAAAIATASAAGAAEQAFEIRFAAKVGGAPLVCGKTYPGVGTTKADIRLQDFRLYVSNVRLLKSGGGEVALRLDQDGVWQDADLALIDFEDASGNCNGNTATHVVVRGKAPAGRYTGLVFDLGVPQAMNHQDPTNARPPLNFSALSWPWRAGYKFVTIDFDASAPTNPKAAGFSIHLGSTDCGEGALRSPPQAPCRLQNRPTYRFEAFDPARQTVVFDLAALVADNDVTLNTPGTPAGCMSGDNDDDCAGVMKRFGLAFRQAPAVAQAWVRVE